MGKIIPITRAKCVSELHKHRCLHCSHEWDLLYKYNGTECPNCKLFWGMPCELVTVPELKSCCAVCNGYYFAMTDDKLWCVGCGGLIKI